MPSCVAPTNPFTKLFAVDQVRSEGTPTELNVVLCPSGAKLCFGIPALHRWNPDVVLRCDILVENWRVPPPLAAFSMVECLEQNTVFVTAGEQVLGVYTIRGTFGHWTYAFSAAQLLDGMQLRARLMLFGSNVKVQHTLVEEGATITGKCYLSSKLPELQETLQTLAKMRVDSFIV